MQIKYAGIDPRAKYAPMYYIRVLRINGEYLYFTQYDPSSDEDDADAFTFEDHGDMFHIFHSVGGKADRFLTRNGQYLETTESTSYGGGEYWRPLRVYKRTFSVDETAQGDIGDPIGKVTLYEYSWVNTVEELMALANDSKNWTNILLAWEDADGYGTNDPNKVWYTKEVWYEEEEPNYYNGARNEFYYHSNDYLGSDGYGSPYAETFTLPNQVGHFQVKLVDWDEDNPVHGYKNAAGKSQESPVFNIRFDSGRGKYIYIGNNGFYDDAKDVEDYTVQLRLGRKDAEDLPGSVWIINNMWGEDEMITRKKNRFDVSDWNNSGYWEFPFRIYTYRPVEYDAIVRNFTIGKGATYSVDKQLIVEKDVIITVEDGGLLTVDKELLNDGKIVVKNGGTVVVNEGGCIMAYDQEDGGTLSLEGGNLLIMDGAKVICDHGVVPFEATNGATILNRGMLVIGARMRLDNNTCLINEEDAKLLVGGRIDRDRGGVGGFSFDEIADRWESDWFTYLITNKSKIINMGVISEPPAWYACYSDEARASIQQRKNGRIFAH